MTTAAKSKKKTPKKPVRAKRGQAVPFKVKYAKKLKEGICVVNGCKRKACADHTQCKEHKEAKAAYMKAYMAAKRDEANGKPEKKKPAKAAKKSAKPKTAKPKKPKAAKPEAPVAKAG